jgi:hypothetical protein
MLAARESGAVTDAQLDGRALAAAYFAAVVQPIAEPILNGSPYGAALLGDGSEVLGYDDAVSTDHAFGPRVQLFLPDAFVATERLERALDEQLPPVFMGRPVRFAHPQNAGGALTHQVVVTTVRAFFRSHLGFDPLGAITPIDWLSVPSARLAGLTYGPVFADGTGELTGARAALEWYPVDVWRAVLAAQWVRIEQEEPFVGRAGSTGDDLGSAVIAARLVRDYMRLGFLVERRYAPYAKWFGRAFGELAIAPEVGPALRRALAANDWRAREAALCEAGEYFVDMTNRLGLAPPIEPARRQFYDRDIRIVGAGPVAIALAGAIADPTVSALVDAYGRNDGVPRWPGAVDQFIDSTDVLTNRARCRAAVQAVDIGAGLPSAP